MRKSEEEVHLEQDTGGECGENEFTATESEQGARCSSVLEGCQMTFGAGALDEGGEREENGGRARQKLQGSGAWQLRPSGLWRSI